MNYYFDWDARKAAQNARKHGVTFQRAATVFTDPNQISLFDESHSEAEERWATIGMDSSGNLLIISHTFVSISADQAILRIISARKATSAETDEYERY